jgi:hypothetical protein
MYDMVGQPEQTVDAYETVRAKGYDHPEEIKGSGLSGGARQRRNEIVKRVMKEQGLSVTISIRNMSKKTISIKKHKIYN